MEKKTSPTQVTYSESVSLFRDDLEEIIKILTAKCERVTIEDNEYNYNSLDEVLDKRGSTPHRLSITGWEPFVRLNIKIKRTRTTLEGSGNGEHLAPFYFIHGLLAKRRRVAQLIAINAPPLLLLVLFILSLNYEQYFQRLSSGLRFVLFMACLVSLHGLTIFHGLGAFSVISLKRQYEQDSFWARNKDSIWVAVIAAIVGGLITWLIIYITTR